MNTQQFEDSINKATSGVLIPGYWSENGFISGKVKLIFDAEDINAYFEFYKYVVDNFRNFNKTIFLEQVSHTKINLSFSVDKEPIVGFIKGTNIPFQVKNKPLITFTIKNLYCPNEMVANFIKGQPRNQSMLMFGRTINAPEPKPFIDKDGFLKPIVNDYIMIHSWDAPASGFKYL